MVQDSAILAMADQSYMISNGVIFAYQFVLVLE